MPLVETMLHAHDLRAFAMKKLEDELEVTEISTSEYEDSSDEEEGEYSDEDSSSGEEEDDDDDDEEDDSEDGSSVSSCSSDDSSLGSAYEQLEAEAAAAAAASGGGRGRPFHPFALGSQGKAKSMQSVLQYPVGKSTPTTKPKRGSIVNAQQKDSFMSFMNRMNSTSAPKIHQSPTSAIATSKATAAALPGQGVAIFGGASPVLALDESTKKKNIRKIKSSGSLDDLKDAERSSVNGDSPNTMFNNLVQSICPDYDGSKHWLPESFWQGYFAPISEERIKYYTMETVRAMRGQDLPKLRQIIQEKGGKAAMEACNQQGESLLHLACRRRNVHLVRFMIEECGVRVSVRDDWGKTPLHELCWQSEPGRPEQFESFKMLIRHAPELLVAKDRRGFLPLQYIPRHSWGDWYQFLDKNKHDLEWKIEVMDFDRSKRQLRSTLDDLHQAKDRVRSTLDKMNSTSTPSA